MNKIIAGITKKIGRVTEPKSHLFFLIFLIIQYKRNKRAKVFHRADAY